MILPNAASVGLSLVLQVLPSGEVGGAVSQPMGNDVLVNNSVLVVEDDVVFAGTLLLELNLKLAFQQAGQVFRGFLAEVVDTKQST